MDSVHKFLSSFSGYVAGAVGAAVGAFFIAVVVQAVKYVKKYRKVNNVQYQAEASMRIRELLVELRLHTGADRVGVMQLANGSYFLNNVSQFNIICTHQSVKPGIAPISLRKDESLITQFPEFFSNVMTGCVHYFVADIPDVLMRAALQRQGVKVMMAAPFYGEKGGLEGMVILDFMEVPTTDVFKEQCDYANAIAARIGYEIKS